jgi:hypothetical protein
LIAYRPYRGHGRSSRTFSLHGPKSRCSSTPTREFNHPQSSRETSLSKLGKSGFADPRALWALLVQQETPNPELRCQRHCLALRQPERRNADGTRTRQLGSTMLWDPTPPRQPRDFTDREFATPNILPLEKPEGRDFQYSGSVPPVHARINDLDQIGKSPSRGFAPSPLVFPSPETRCPEVAILDVVASPTITSH